jgi:hypothetical protein
MDRKRRILIVNSLNCILEKCIGRHGKEGAGLGAYLVQNL